MEPNFNFKSAFNPVTDSSNSHLTQNIEKQCKEILHHSEKLQISQLHPSLFQVPYLLRLLFGIYAFLVKKCETSKTNIASSTQEFLTHRLKSSLFKVLCGLIQKKLFQINDPLRLFQQSTYSLVFKQCLVSFVISFISEGSDVVMIDKAITIYKTLTSQNHSKYLPIHIYYLYGGAIFSIEVKTFKQKLTNLFQCLGKTLSQSQTIINRNIQFYQANQQRRTILDDSLKIVMLSKDKQALAQIINQIAQSIFQQKSNLNKDQFIHRIYTKPINPLITVFFSLLRLQAIVLQHLSLRSQPNQNISSKNPNFYASELAKLFNKCPFNGDERCDCKKCQCVRRNRESAKLNQQKKRNAVQQVNILQQKLLGMQKLLKNKDDKILQLQQQNLMLKGLLKSMKFNPQLQQLMRETIQPISKVLQNQD